MPLAAFVGLSGTVTGAAAAATLTGSVTNASQPPATLVGTVSGAHVASWEGDVLAYGFRVVLDGREVPPEDLHGPLTVERSLDTHLTTWQFGLVGPRYRPLATQTTWTRIPVEVYVHHGPPGAVTEDEPYLSGVVFTGEPSESGQTVQVRCADFTLLAEKVELCHEVEPFSGLTRGQILRELFAAAGITQVDVPPGAAYDKPLFTDSARLWRYVRDFAEPEGWHFRARPDRSLETYTADLVEAPLPPHHEWGEGDFTSLQLSPPDGATSRWVVRGERAVYVDEVGFTTTVTSTEIQAIYAPKVAVQRQETSGSITDLSPGLPAPILRTVARIENQLTTRGTLPVHQVTREWGYYNPAAAKLRTHAQGEPPGSVDGFYYVQALIDEEGRYVLWPQERFVQVGERRGSWSYDVDQNPTGTTTRTWRWNSRKMGVRTAAGAWAVDVRVGGDDQSYFSPTSIANQLEVFELAEQQDVAYTYGPTGAVIAEDEETFAHYSPRAAVDSGTGYVLYDGTGQQDLVANWTRTGARATANSLSADGLLTGSSTVTSGYATQPKADGAYDWGDGKSNLLVEVFKVTGTESVENHILGETTYERVEFKDGERVATLIHGALPKPRYRTSPWTRLVQEPVELLLEDELVEQWFRQLHPGPQ